ncbi:hypothetical protein MMC28_009958 [Mycoblastus sanguinarius]|nr:hypothetical protein [Mycoblastus sanguinarius]
MRVDEYEIEGPLDDIKWTKAQKAAYAKLSLPDVLKEVAENEATNTPNYHPIPVIYRAPTINIPSSDPTPYELFSIFITPELLDRVALYTNIKVDKWFKDPTKKKFLYERPWEDITGLIVGVYITIRILMGLDPIP